MSPSKSTEGNVSPSQENPRTPEQPMRQTSVSSGQSCAMERNHLPLKISKHSYSSYTLFGCIELLHSKGIAQSVSNQTTPTSPSENKLMCHPQQHAVLFLVIAPRQPSPNLVEPWWNLGGTLVEPYLRAAADHPEAYLG